MLSQTDQSVNICVAVFCKFCYTVTKRGASILRQEEKNRKSRELILGYAFDEFAENGYAGSSLNQICARGSISKGLLYHYYANKDALYLACVGRLFQDMTAFLQARIDVGSVTVQQYFSVRLDFFRQNPAHRQLFYDVILYPQSHLSAQIKQCRQGFDDLNNQLLRVILQQEHLSENLSADAALRQFRTFVDFLGVYIRADSKQDAERKTAELLHTMLYGLVAR